jgi:uncharacterized membrane protein
MSEGLPRLDEGAAIAVISFAVLEVFRTYQGTAPKLSEVRKAPKDDWEAAQLLLDADVMTGILVVIMGIAGIFLMNRKYPLVFLVITWLAVSGYYHAVRNSPHDVNSLEG